MKKIPSKKTGLARVIAAFNYSLDGLRAAFISEAAFRQEIFLFFLLLPVVFFLPVSNYIKCLLLMANTLVLIVELLNSGIEAVVDMTSPEYHKLAKQAKDMGSAAVLLSLLLTVSLWGYALITAYYGSAA